VAASPARAEGVRRTPAFTVHDGTQPCNFLVPNQAMWSPTATGSLPGLTTTGRLRGNLSMVDTRGAPQQEKGRRTSMAAALNQLGRDISQQLLESSASLFLSPNSRHASTGRGAHCAKSNTSSSQNLRAAPRVINTPTSTLSSDGCTDGSSD
jgi:hypothetical protein